MAGDFNAILGPHGKIGNLPRISCTEFLSFIVDCDLNNNTEIQLTTKSPQLC